MGRDDETKQSDRTGPSGPADARGPSRPGSADPGPVPVASPRQLAFATLAAFLLAVVALLAVILPAAYGLDPVGTGALFSFGPDSGDDPLHAQREDTVELTLQHNFSIVWAFEVEEGAGFEYAWNASAPVAPEIATEPAGGGERVVLEGDLEPQKGHAGFLQMPQTGWLVFTWSAPDDAQENVELEFRTSGAYRLIGALR